MQQEEEREEKEENLADFSTFPPPRIFTKCSDTCRSGEFDTITLYLNGRMESDLNWKEARQKALEAIEKGYRLMWQMDLGFFDQLKQPMMHQGQFLSFSLALEHFRDGLWSEFSSKSIGLSFFCGNLEFTCGFPWDLQQEENLTEWLREHQFLELATLPLASLQQHPLGPRVLPLFCRDVVIEYLSLLAARLPETIPVYLLLDAGSFTQSLVTQVQLLHPEHFERFHLILKQATLPFEAIGWDFPTHKGYRGEISLPLPPLHEPSIGLCLPPGNCYHPSYYQGFEEVVAILGKKRLPFKLIAENQLTLRWTGLDFLFYFSSGLSPQGKRKVQGFCAAGGVPIAVQERVGFMNEQDLKEWVGHDG